MPAAGCDPDLPMGMLSFYSCDDADLELLHELLLQECGVARFSGNGLLLQPQLRRRILGARDFLRISLHCAIQLTR